VVAAAQAATADILKPPTTLGVTTPLKTAAPTGKTIVYMKCQVTQCALYSDAIEEAAKAIGWNYKAINWDDTDPSTLFSGIKTALQYNPVAISFGGLSESVWASIIPTVKAAGSTLIPITTEYPTIDDTVIGAVFSSNDFAAQGKILGTYAVADSNGTAKVLFVDTPAYGIFKAETEAGQDVVKTCSGCSATTLDLSQTQLVNNGAVAAVVSALQRDRSIKYVSLCDGAFFTGLPSALKAAGINDVKIIGAGPTTTDLQNLLNGTETAFTGSNYGFAGWAVVDEAARHVEGMEVPQDDGGSPNMLLTKDNVGTPSVSMELPSDYKDQFKQLWHVS